MFRMILKLQIFLNSGNRSKLNQNQPIEVVGEGAIKIIIIITFLFFQVSERDFSYGLALGIKVMGVYLH